MKIAKFQITHQALLDVAKSEYKYLAESKANDGFDMGELVILDATDEELHIVFALKMNGKTVSFKYSLGFDGDEDGYWPYVAVEAGDDEDPIEFSIKHVGGNSYVRGDLDLLGSIEWLARICGEARFAAFQWLERHKP